ncbi:hypothetical protein SAMN05216349_15013 [Oribacterium sp. KHPX15]|uniref:hypothetical protein n=1 Tax=unclassified Oribacterium TaxID=2629782 RepID=UPI0004E0F730|nr:MULTISPECIES: hypothetical protein [unclassified Oribacterium]MBP3802922.1 hypothetical protein [Oribacterium sp.]SEA90785.1 hypothetical protein SAMN05216349_15013 [Oribacterium sp. KHPX15]
MKKELEIIEPVEFADGECPYCHSEEPGNCPDEYLFEAKEKYTPDPEVRELGIEVKNFGIFDTATNSISVNVMINDVDFMKTKRFRINYCPMCGRKF